MAAERRSWPIRKADMADARPGLRASGRNRRSVNQGNVAQETQENSEPSGEKTAGRPRLNDEMNRTRCQDSRWASRREDSCLKNSEQIPHGHSLTTPQNHVTIPANGNQTRKISRPDARRMKTTRPVKYGQCDECKIRFRLYHNAGRFCSTKCRNKSHGRKRNEAAKNWKEYEEGLERTKALQEKI